MSYKLADGTFSVEYKEGDKFKVVGNEVSCSETTVGEIVILSVDDGTANPYFIAEDGSGSGERVCYWKELEKYEESSLPEYTPEQLTYISELEDRVNYLEALCEDYAEHIKQLETTQQSFKPISEMTIEDWQQALDEGWLFETEQKGVVEIIKTEFDDSSYTVLVGCDGNTWWVNSSGFDVDLEGYTILRRVK